MIHIATVHWATDRWIDVQLHYLERHIDQPYRVYACLDEIERDYSSRFYYSLSLEKTRHPDKLNLLAEMITGEAAGDDLIVFIDGDAFPIAPLAPAATQMLAKHPLAAIRRDENLGDPQPHPSFCVTTVAFWQELGGDWSRGQTWLNAEGETVNDPGGKVLKALEDRGFGWNPILRSNARNLHPIMFGVYGNAIYHHGAGFRHPLSRSEIARIPGAGELAGAAQGSPERRQYLELTKELRDENERLSEFVFDRIRSDDDFAHSLFLTGP
jgi:hypothetical protein